MRIYVLNLKKHRFATTFTAVVLALIILSAISISVVTRIFRNELFIEKAAAIPYEKIVILDAGHGGEDSGAIGKNGRLEKDLNLEIALEIGAALEERGYVVVYTRTDDRLLYTESENIKGIRKISDLKNRCKVAANYPDSTFVSIHMNSFGGEKYSGLQVYHKPDDSESRALADAIQQRVITEIQPENNRKIKSGSGMYVLENVENTAVLIECGFLTNRDECEKLSEKEYQKRLSLSIVCAIIEYIED
ncbi:MAG: N-acetylmuramoyl-L-alanine amidase [Ruminococcaceae bacterium]|nr:N-acetylmuramoyl-L-alanine amidase [Oscillospiraceae bacterium]